MDKIREKRSESVKMKDENDIIKLFCENEAYTRDLKGKVETFNGIFENIRERVMLLQSKCIVKYEMLSNSQILEKVKETRLLDSDYSEILDWITELIKVCPSGYTRS